jgi:hypothetical protein
MRLPFGAIYGTFRYEVNPSLPHDDAVASG